VASVSASERLRALDYPQRGRIRKLTDALPLIADVVEAAEDMAGYDWHALKHLVGGDVDGMQAMDMEDAEQLKESRRKAQAALTALREHLEGGDEGRSTAYGPGQPGWADYGGPGYVEGGDE
jgi:hypothetical protein